MRDAIFIKRKNICRLPCIIFLLFVFSAHSFAESEANEPSIKAMFILNFVKYIEWPPESNKESLQIGIAGESKVYDALLSLIIARKEKEKIKIQKVNMNSIIDCHILFIPQSEKSRSEEWSKNFQRKGVLVITEDAVNGNNSTINLVCINSKIRFEINNTQAKHDGIKISSRLTELAIIVKP